MGIIRFSIGLAVLAGSCSNEIPNTGEASPLDRDDEDEEQRDDADED